MRRVIVVLAILSVLAGCTSPLTPPTPSQGAQTETPSATSEAPHDTQPEPTSVPAQETPPPQPEPTSPPPQGNLPYQPQQEPVAKVKVTSPSGPSQAKTNEDASFIVGDSMNASEFRFDWGDGAYSDWSSSPSASHSWSSPGIYLVKAQARSGSQSSNWSNGIMVTVEPTGPVRDPYLPKQMMAFITPDDPMVQLAMDDILKQRMQVFFTDFEELRDWVSWHITYVSDQQAHGTPDYWQLPAETLRLGAGDCEDFAILLCSLLRAAGAPADEVYVACGHNKDQAVDHAYLAEKWYTGLWQIVEPEAGVWMGMLMMDWATSEDYETIFCFNDQGFITGLPKLPEGVYEVEVPASFWPMFPGATVVYERYLQSGETVHAKVQWMKDYAMVSDWTFNIWGPTYGPEATNKKAYTWSGRDLGKSFTFTPQGEGIYRIEILKRDALPRPVRLTVDPEDWEPWPK